jgi:hypothetical protein
VVKIQDRPPLGVLLLNENMEERRRFAIEEICETNQTGLKKQAALSDQDTTIPSTPIHIVHFELGMSEWFGFAQASCMSEEFFL